MAITTAPVPVSRANEGPNKVLLVFLGIVAAVALFMYVVKPLFFAEKSATVTKTTQPAPLKPAPIGGTAQQQAPAPVSPASPAAPPAADEPQTFSTRDPFQPLVSGSAGSAGSSGSSASVP